MMPGCTLPSVRRGPRAAAALAGTLQAVPSGAAAALACTPRDIMSRAAAALAGTSQAVPSGAAAAPAWTSPAIVSRVAAASAIRSQSVAAPAARPADPAVASWPALGTVAALAVTDPMLLPAARELLAAEIAAVDAACSSFREDSEIAAVNAIARRQHGPVRISPLLADAIGAALLAAGWTGDVDPLAGPGPAVARADLAAGQAGGQADPAARAGTRTAHGVPVMPWRPATGTTARLTVASCASWRQVRLDAARGLLSLPPGSWLDLGATAKAWAADRAAARIAARLGCGVLVSLGGDVASCGTAPRGGWRVRVQDNAAPAVGQAAVPAAVVSIRGGGLATVGAGAARWHCGGDVLAHVLRPPGRALAASPWRLASVTAATCLQARAASIAAMIRGNDAIGWLAGRGLAARLVETGGRVRTVASWPADPAGTVDPAGLPGIAGQSPLPGMIAATFAASGTETLRDQGTRGCRT
jgi:FAD:protein FMN transferase